MNDTTARIRFNIPAQPLADALGQFSRQAAVRVEVDAEGAAGVRSQGVSGTYTAAEALRRLLDGSGLSARFPDEGTVRVARGVAAGEEAYTLTPLTVVASSSRGYGTGRTTSATRTDTPLRDAPQSVSVVTQGLIADQSMQGMADVVRYVPGVTMGQGEGHRDAPTIRGNSCTADFFVDGVRDDAQYLRDLYNVERVEALKGSNAMIFGRGGGGGVLNRVSKEAQWAPTRVVTTEGGSFDHKRATVDLGQGLGAGVAVRFNGMYENSGGFRDAYELERFGINPTLALARGRADDGARGVRAVQRRPHGGPRHPLVPGAAVGGGHHHVLRQPGPELVARCGSHAANATVEHATAGGLTIRNRSRWTSYDKFYQNSFPGAVNAAGTQVNLSAYNNAHGPQQPLQPDGRHVGDGARAACGTRCSLGAEVGRQETENFRETGYYNDAATSFAVPFDAPTVSTPITFRQSATDADNRATATVAAVYVQDQVELSPHVQAGGRHALRPLRRRVPQQPQRRRPGPHGRPGVAARGAGAQAGGAGVVLRQLQRVVPAQLGRPVLLADGHDGDAGAGAVHELRGGRQVGRAARPVADRRPCTGWTAPTPRRRTRTTPRKIVQTGSQRTDGVGAGGDRQRDAVVAGGGRLRVAAGADHEHDERGARRGSRCRWCRSTHAVAVEPLAGAAACWGWGWAWSTRPTCSRPSTTRSRCRASRGWTARCSCGSRALLSAQLNVENLFDERYYATSHGNNNIMPGAARTLRLSLTTRR